MLSCNKTANNSKNDGSSNTKTPTTTISGSDSLQFDVLEFTEVEKIYQQLVERYGKSAILNGSIPNDNELMEFFVPLISNGERLHADLVFLASNSPEWANLSSDEKLEVQNYDDRQLAMLAIVFATHQKIHNNDQNGDFQVLEMSENMRMIVGCLGAALGIPTGVGNIIGNTSKLINLTGKQALTILRTVGSRFLGWVGLALAIIAFVDCID